MAVLFALSSNFRERYYRVVKPLGNFLARWGIHPHVLTAGGLILSFVAGLVYAKGSFFWGAWILVLAGVCDTLDGQIARQAGKQSHFGAFFDSTLDRYSDLFPLAGMAYCFSGGSPGVEPSPRTVFVIIMAIAGAYMVSYTRARAEALGVECREGFMQRPERITLLILGSFLGALPVVGLVLLKSVLVVLAVASNGTALSRMILTKKRLMENRGGAKGEARNPRNPFPTVDVIIETGKGIILIKRKNFPFGWALPGGFVDYGESLEAAAEREATEETSLHITGLSQFGAYSDPGRDPRQHTLTVVFTAQANGEPRAADDAADIGVFTRESLPEDLAFDHGRILRDYFDARPVMGAAGQDLAQASKRLCPADAD